MNFKLRKINRFAVRISVIEKKKRKVGGGGGGSSAKKDFLIYFLIKQVCSKHMLFN